MFSRYIDFQEYETTQLEDRTKLCSAGMFFDYFLRKRTVMKFMYLQTTDSMEFFDEQKQTAAGVYDEGCFFLSRISLRSNSATITGFEPMIFAEQLLYRRVCL